MTHLRALRLSAGLLGLVAFGRVSGQERTPVVTPGQTVDGMLTSKLPALALLGGRPVRVYRLNADSGYVYKITLRSSVFDSYLVVGRTVAGITDYVAKDDDGGGVLDAMLRFQASATEPYLVLVTAAAPHGDYLPDTGAFTLRVDRFASGTAVPRRIAVGDSVVSRLDDQSAANDLTGAPYALYQVHAERGRPITLQYKSDSVRAEVVVGRMAGVGFVPASDTAPDRGQSLVSTFDPPETGDFIVRILATGSASSGSYVFRIASSTAAAVTRTAQSGGALSPGQGQTAALTGTSASWALAVPRQQRINISLQSNVFDTYLWLGRDSAGRVIPVDSSDDAPGEQTNSRLALTTPGPGNYVIRVSAAVGTPSGAYTLRVDTVSVTRIRLQRTRIAAGQQVSGVLGTSDAMLTDGSPYQEWIYAPTRVGERVEVTMRSREFDTYLAVGRMERRNGREEFVPISVNDDGRDDDHKSSRVSRVVLIAPDRHDLVIRANTWGPQAGRYTLDVARKEPDALSTALLHDPLGSLINPP